MAINVSLEMTDTFNQWVEKINSLADQANTEIENLGSNATYPVFKGATAHTYGKAGLVPAPTIDDRNKFLKSDGTWSEEPTTIRTDYGRLVTDLPFLLSGVNTSGDIGVVYQSPSNTGMINDNHGSYWYSLHLNNIIGHVSYTTKTKKIETESTFNCYEYTYDDNMITYAECTSAGDSSIKVVNTNPIRTFANDRKSVIRVKFANDNTASNIKMNVNGSGNWFIVQSCGYNFNENLHKIIPSRIKANHVYIFIRLNDFDTFGSTIPEELREQNLWYMIGGSDITANHFNTNLLSTPEIVGIQTMQVDSSTQFAIKSQSYLNVQIAYYEVKVVYNDNVILEQTYKSSKYEYTPIEIAIDSSLLKGGEECVLKVVAIDTLGNRSEPGIYNFVVTM